MPNLPMRLSIPEDANLSLSSMEQNVMPLENIQLKISSNLTKFEEVTMMIINK